MNSYLIEFFFLLILIIFALIQRMIILKDIEKKRSGSINHFAWACLYAGLMGLAYWGNSSWQLMVCLVVMRIMFFNPLLNHLNNNPFFHLGKESKVDLLIGGIYRPIYVACWIVFITLQFFI